MLSKEENLKYRNGYITKDLIKEQMDTNNIAFYLCGPPSMMDAVLKKLKQLKIDDSKIVQKSY